MTKSYRNLIRTAATFTALVFSVFSINPTLSYAQLYDDQIAGDQAYTDFDPEYDEVPASK